MEAGKGHAAEQRGGWGILPQEEKPAAEVKFQQTCIDREARGEVPAASQLNNQPTKRTEHPKREAAASHGRRLKNSTFLTMPEAAIPTTQRPRAATNTNTDQTTLQRQKKKGEEIDHPTTREKIENLPPISP